MVAVSTIGRSRLLEGYYSCGTTTMSGIEVFALHELHDPQEPFKPLRLSPDQRRLASYLQDLSHRNAIVSAGRGAGKTLMGAILAVWSTTALAESLKKPHRVVVIGGTQSQADKLYDWCLRFFEQSRYLNSRVKGDPMRSKTLFKNGSAIHVFPASEGGVRHEHADLLIFDEAVVARDEMLRASFSIVDESPYPRIVLLSTPHDPMSLFVTIWQDAERWGFEKFNWDASRCEWKDKAVIATRETTLSREEFTVEYRGLPSSYENAIFDFADIRECRISEKPKAQGDTPVIVGIDWGFAPGLHDTVATAVQRQEEYFIVLCAEKVEGKPEEKQERIKTIYHELRAERVFADMSHISENQRLAEAGLQVTQVPFQNRKKEMVYRAQRLFQQRLVRIFDQELELIRQLTNYQWAESKTGKLTPMKGRDDFVDSLLLALTGADTYHAPSMIKIGHYR
ncbi:MAG TPA: hypothetical protein G4O03_00615 [Dehalococcoidia bacterium]|jgi:hypothetical protein|nr:hypothetical protein [Dehalococcoidia bacterium]